MHSTCVYDGVKVYQGRSPTGTPLAKVCGHTIPGPFSTFGPMLVNFYSDSVINDNGFMAEYRAIRECFGNQCRARCIGSGDLCTMSLQMSASIHTVSR